MAGRSASSLVRAAARHHSPARRRVCSPSPGCRAQCARLLGGRSREALRLPDLELVALADEDRPRRRSRHASSAARRATRAVGVDLQNFAGRHRAPSRELFVLLRIGREARNQRRRSPPAARCRRIDRRPVERRIAIEPLEPVARQHRPERRRDRYPSLRVEPQRCNGTRNGPSRPCSPPRGCSGTVRTGPIWSHQSPRRHLVGPPGCAWEIMGYHGNIWASMGLGRYGQPRARHRGLPQRLINGAQA